MLPLYDVIPSRRKPVINYTLIALNTIIFLFELAIPEPILNNIIYTFGVVPVRFWAAFNYADWKVILDHAILPAFTSMFLHGGWLHLLSNMWMLWIFGDNVEDTMGHLRYLAFYLLCGLAAALTHATLYASSPVPTIGASGAISGVMGAYMLLYPGSRIVTLIPFFFFPMLMEFSAYFFLLAWFIGQLLAGATSLAMGGSNIAFWAHVGGFVAGLLLHRLFVTYHPVPKGYWTRKTLWLDEEEL